MMSDIPILMENCIFIRTLCEGIYTCKNKNIPQYDKHDIQMSCFICYTCRN